MPVNRTTRPSVAGLLIVAAASLGLLTALAALAGNAHEPWESHPPGGETTHASQHTMEPHQGKGAPLAGPAAHALLAGAALLGVGGGISVLLARERARRETNQRGYEDGLTW